jgi:hypothetical protein
MTEARKKTVFLSFFPFFFFIFGGGGGKQIFLGKPCKTVANFQPLDVMEGQDYNI